MAKKKNMVLVKLESTAKKEDGKSTGYFIVRKKDPRKPKLALRKFDPVIRQHVEFVEKKLK